jgi:predicted Zn finger-like uncharacterized protein
MIIQCINCYKKFEVSASLIPSTGRNIICGSCNHSWFYKNDVILNTEVIEDNNKNESSNIKKLSEKSYSIKISDKENNLTEEVLSEDIILDKTKKKEVSSIGMGKILSFLIVLVISFISLVIILDTFKSPLTNIFPSLELKLYNLFETLEDIFLFLKNLLI